MYIVQVCLSVCLTVCLNIQGYCVKHLSDNKAKNTRKGRYSGGIYIYDKSNLYGKIEITQKHQNGIVWLKIDRALFYFNIDSYMRCTYIPPKGSTLVVNNMRVRQQSLYCASTLIRFLVVLKFSYVFTRKNPSPPIPIPIMPLPINFFLKKYI